MPATLDSLAEAEPVVAVAEHVLPIRFSVLVRPGTAPGGVRTVATHPHAAAQVRRWIAEHLPAATTVLTTSTSAAAVAVVDGNADAAVCAPVAAAHYALHELATGVHDIGDAETRFLLLRRPGTLPARTGTDRTSLVAVAADRPGALLEVLAEFALRSINLTRIESRPMKGRLGSTVSSSTATGTSRTPRSVTLLRSCTAAATRCASSAPTRASAAPAPDPTRPASRPRRTGSPRCAAGAGREASGSRRADHSAPAELVQPGLGDAEVVRDLVHHGDRNLVDHLVLVGADVQQRVPVHGDPVRQHPP